jgi:two-component system KDP operon response regulator KdpE
MDELILRIRVAFRHIASLAGGVGSTGVFQTGGLGIDFERRQVALDGQAIHLTPTEYEVLKYLAQHVGKVITHQMILHTVWGPGYEDAVATLRVFIRTMRQKIEADPSRPRYLLTVSNVGYRLAALPAPAADSRP